MVHKIFEMHKKKSFGKIKNENRKLRKFGNEFGNRKFGNEFGNRTDFVKIFGKSDLIAQACLRNNY
jgi:hypothetical protein